jgi:hypothetical protein
VTTQALEASAALNAIDVDSPEVTAMSNVGHQPQAAVYLANAAPEGDG